MRQYGTRRGPLSWPAVTHARVLCGSGQQRLFRAPQRVERMAFEIVSSGASMWGLMPLGGDPWTFNKRISRKQTGLSGAPER